MRKRFDMGSGNTPAIGWGSFEGCQNAIRAQRINEMLDAGTRVFGDDGPDGPGAWHEIDEAIYPFGNGIDVRTKAGKTVRIYAYDASDKRQNDPQ